MASVDRPTPNVLPRGIAGGDRGSLDASIRLARTGCAQSLGELYEGCRRYLLLIANQELDDEFRAKLGPSDLVQETLLAAQRAFDRFEGSTEAELRRWLRRILLNNILLATRQFQGEMRDVRRERTLQVALAEQDDLRRFADPNDTPSTRAMADEQTAALTAALFALPEHYRRVVVLRSIERKPFREIGVELGRGEGAARKLWLRAIELLRHALEGNHGTP